MSEGSGSDNECDDECKMNKDSKTETLCIKEELKNILSKKDRNIYIEDLQFNNNGLVSTVPIVHKHNSTPTNYNIQINVDNNEVISEDSGNVLDEIHKHQASTFYRRNNITTKSKNRVPSDRKVKVAYN